MSNNSMAALQAAFAKRQTSGDNDQSNSKVPYYPFWKMNADQQCVLRFLEDPDGDNPFQFLVEKVMHRLDINGQQHSVPCLSMWDEPCPVCKVSKDFYDRDDEINGKKYWKNRQHLALALVVEDPLQANDDSQSHQGKVRAISLGYQIFKIISETITSNELDIPPYKAQGGTDFIIKKTQQGTHASYMVGTKFARTSTDLSEDVIQEIQPQLVELSELLPAKPNVEKIESMLQSALTGASLDSTSVPSTPVGKAPATKAPATKAPATPEVPAVEAEASVAAGSDEDPDAILARIRARRG